MRHPLFWWSLPAIVAIGNAIAILAVNRRHRRGPFTDRPALAVVFGVLSFGHAGAVHAGVAFQHDAGAGAVARSAASPVLHPSSSP